MTAALEPIVINEIMDIVNSFRASIRMFNVTENDRQSTYEITMKIAVPSNLELDKVTSQIRNLRNVIKISRMYLLWKSILKKELQRPEDCSRKRAIIVARRL